MPLFGEIRPPRTILALIEPGSIDSTYKTTLASFKTISLFEIEAALKKSRWGTGKIFGRSVEAV